MQPSFPCPSQPGPVSREWLRHPGSAPKPEAPLLPTLRHSRLIKIASSLCRCSGAGSPQPASCLPRVSSPGEVSKVFTVASPFVKPDYVP